MMKRIAILAVMLVSIAMCFGWATYYVDVLGGANNSVHVSMNSIAPGQCNAGSDTWFLENVGPNIGRYWGYGWDPTIYGPVTMTAEAWRNLSPGTTGISHDSITIQFPLTSDPGPYYIGLLELQCLFGGDEEQNH